MKKLIIKIFLISTLFFSLNTSVFATSLDFESLLSSLTETTKELLSTWATQSWVINTSSTWTTNSEEKELNPEEQGYTAIRLKDKTKSSVFYKKDNKIYAHIQWLGVDEFELIKSADISSFKHVNWIYYKDNNTLYREYQAWYLEREIWTDFYLFEIDNRNYLKTKEWDEFVSYYLDDFKRKDLYRADDLLLINESNLSIIFNLTNYQSKKDLYNKYKNIKGLSRIFDCWWFWELNMKNQPKIDEYFKKRDYEWLKNYILADKNIRKNLFIETSMNDSWDFSKNKYILADKNWIYILHYYDGYDSFVILKYSLDLYSWKNTFIKVENYFITSKIINEIEKNDNYNEEFVLDQILTWFKNYDFSKLKAENNSFINTPKLTKKTNWYSINYSFDKKESNLNIFEWYVVYKSPAWKYDEVYKLDNLKPVSIDKSWNYLYNIATKYKNLEKWKNTYYFYTKYNYWCDSWINFEKNEFIINH